MSQKEAGAPGVNKYDNSSRRKTTSGLAIKESKSVS